MALTHRPLAQSSPELGDPAFVLPAFGSTEHQELIAHRLSRNLAFRARLEAWSRLPIDDHRRAARRLVAEATQGGAIPMELLT
jgi:hypothetical protein